MNAAIDSAKVSRIVSSIPERTARTLTGTAFNLDGARACSDPARLAGIVRLLQWLSPLTPLSQDEQRVLGLHVASARPGGLADDDEPGREAPPMEESVL
ncbi:MAG TPA: hypothetical protein VF211_12070 [Burkholderiales bacterium]